MRKAMTPLGADDSIVGIDAIAGDGAVVSQLGVASDALIDGGITC